MTLNRKISTTALIFLGNLFVFNPLLPIHALDSDKADEYTVRIEAVGSGSGVIIKREANTYTVLTNNHVVISPEENATNSSNEYSVVTHNENKYKVIPNTILSVKGVDLAVLQFISNNNYPVVEVGDSNKLKKGDSIFINGWSSPFKGFPDGGNTFFTASLTGRVKNPKDGYELMFLPSTVPGVSGSPILDSRDHLIGINGRSSCNGHTCFGFAIPIQVYLDNKDNQLPVVEITVPEDFISIGEEEARKGNYRNAIAEYNKALKEEPENLLDIYYLRGEAFFALRDYDAAIEDFSQFVRLSPKNYLAYFYRGYIRAENDDFSGAIADYNQAIEIDPNFSLAYTNRGRAYSRLGNTQSAIDDYNKAISINPNSATAHYNRGLVLGRDLEKFQEALADFDKAIELNPEEAEAYLNRGNVYNALQEWQPAIDNYSKAIEIDPNHAEAHYNRGVVNYQNQEFQKSLEDFQRASTLFKAQGDDANYKRALERISEISGAN